MSCVAPPDLDKDPVSATLFCWYPPDTPEYPPRFPDGRETPEDPARSPLTPVCTVSSSGSMGSILSITSTLPMVFQTLKIGQKGPTKGKIHIIQCYLERIFFLGGRGALKLFVWTGPRETPLPLKIWICPYVMNMMLLSSGLEMNLEVNTRWCWCYVTLWCNVFPWGGTGGDEGDELSVWAASLDGWVVLTTAHFQWI